MARVRIVALSALCALVLMPSSQATAAPDRYSLVHGCYELRSQSLDRVVAADSGPFRLQATTLGRYLLYGKAEDFLAASGDGSVEAAAEPSPAADWRVDEAGGAFRLFLPSEEKYLEAAADGTLALGPGEGERALFTFVEAEGCPEYPEIELSATGSPFTEPTSFGEVRGFVEGHMHMMAFEFLGGSAHCGRPWHRYGVAYALVDCPDHTATGGCGAVLETVLSGGPCHDPVGWPTFNDWPHRNSLTHEGSYYRWVERAWLGGLRLYVNLLVENSVLCEIYPLKRNSCDEMDSIRLQARDLYELQDYIDAQSGGPGKGFFRIVTSPFEARRVIASGKLAVVLGIEVSELFGCSHFNYQPDCGKEDIDRQLDDVHRMGVRQMELVNKFDNALAGVAGDSGATGVVVNTGNKYETNTFWDLQTCSVGEGDKEQPALPRDLIIGAGLQAFLPQGQLPVYPPPPHCNTRGLTTLGEHLVRRMMERRMIVDPDHLSQLARNHLLDLVEANDYPGIVSSHSWSNDQDYPRILQLGGVVTPSDGSSERFVEDWRFLRANRNPRYVFGLGYGADTNGLSSGAAPREDPENPVEYPFKSFDGGVTLDKQRSGERVFDFNEDGVAHYGLYPDWIEDMRMVAGDAIVRDMARGAEAYLQMWERAEGVPAPRCRARSARIRRGGVRHVRVALAPVALLRTAGQPQERNDRVWRWCVRSSSMKRKRVTAVLTPRGRSALVASNVRAHRAGRIGFGDPLKRVAKRSQPFGKRLWVRPAGGGRRFVYGVRAGRVTFAGVATRAAARSPRKLRGYARLGGLL